MSQVNELSREKFVITDDAKCRIYDGDNICQPTLTRDKSASASVKCEVFDKQTPENQLVSIQCDMDIVLPRYYDYVFLSAAEKKAIINQLPITMFDCECNKSCKCADNMTRKFDMHKMTVASLKKRDEKAITNSIFVIFAWLKCNQWAIDEPGTAYDNLYDEMLFILYRWSFGFTSPDKKPESMIKNSGFVKSMPTIFPIIIPHDKVILGLFASKINKLTKTDKIKMINALKLTAPLRLPIKDHKCSNVSDKADESAPDEKCIFSLLNNNLAIDKAEKYYAQKQTNWICHRTANLFIQALKCNKWAVNNDKYGYLIDRVLCLMQRIINFHK